jgi:hypothetical protein
MYCTQIGWVPVAVLHVVSVWAVVGGMIVA